jgi:hypothetical protein
VRMSCRLANECSKSAWRRFARVALACGFMAVCSALPVTAQQPQRVLMLHGFNYTFPATTRIGEAARKSLLERSGKKIEVDAEFLDLARAVKPDYEPRLAEFLRQKYARRPPDVVMTLGSAALHLPAEAPRLNRSEYPGRVHLGCLSRLC